MISLDEFKEEKTKEIKGNSTKNKNRCDCWEPKEFKSSSNQKFIAYLVNRTEIIYNPNHEKKSNWIVVTNLENGESRLRSSMKYFETGIPHDKYKDRHIESILEVSDNGKVKYKTLDTRTHEF